MIYTKNSKMAEVDNNLEIITLNKNELKPHIKWQILAELIFFHVDITITNISETNNKDPKYMKQKLRKLKRDITIYITQQ